MSIVYNYVDLVLRNDTDTTFQISVTVGDTYLERFFHARGSTSAPTSSAGV